MIGPTINAQNTLLSQMNRISSQIAKKKEIGSEPLFSSAVEYLKYLQACFAVEKGYVEETDKETIQMAKTYNERIAQFNEYTKGKNLSLKEKNKLLYGN